MTSLPPSAEAQQSILEAIELVEQGDRKKAAQWLESGFRLASSLPSLSPDLLYFADAAVRLNLLPLVTHPKLRALIPRVRDEGPMLNYPEPLLARFPDSSDLPEDTRESYSRLAEAFKLAQKGHDPERARGLAMRALENFRRVRDAQGELEALHFSGRVEHELDNLDQAMIWYDRTLEAAYRLNDERAIARAMHERARIFEKRDHDFLQAEAGYRHALNYYARHRDEANLQVAINGLARLAEGALSFDEFFLPLLEKEGVPVGSPAQYLHIRGAAIRAELGENYLYYLRLLLQWAGQELERDANLARYIVREVVRIADFRQDQRFSGEIDELNHRLG